MNRTLICMLLAFFCATSYAITAEDTIEIIAGLIDGIIQENDLAILQSCLTDVDDITNEIINAVNDFEEGTYASVILGIEQLCEVLLQLPADLKGCSAMGSDLDALEAWMEIFIHPAYLLDRLE